MPIQVLLSFSNNVFSGNCLTIYAWQELHDGHHEIVLQEYLFANVANTLHIDIGRHVSVERAANYVSAELVK